MRKRQILIAWAVAAASCVATPLPQPPLLELDIEKVSAEQGGETLVISGTNGAVSRGSIDIRVTPGPTDTDPILEIGTTTVDTDGAFDVAVISPLPNTFFFETILADEDVFFAAIVIDEAGNISEGDPGPDSDDDGSPDEIDCAPDDATLGGQRCE